jgi:hypothetical protein
MSFYVSRTSLINSDAAGVSATFLMTAPIAEDLHISFANEAWVLGTYSMVL